MLPSNPFIVNGAIPAPYFCDRKTETEQLSGHIRNGRNVVLSSARRLGKTGLIQHCFEAPELSEGTYLFFVDILQTSSLQEFVYVMGSRIFETLKPRSRKMLDMFVQTVRSLSTEFGYDPLSGMPTFNVSMGAIANPEYTLDEIFRYIDLADKRCVIAIDEFQQITRYPEKNVEAVLRAHIQHCRNAVFLFAGSERHILADMFSAYSRPFYASSAMMNLEPLERDVYKQFVIEHFAEFGKRVDEGVPEQVYDLFAGNTYCMQRTFNVAFEHTPEGGSCTASTIDEAVELILQELDYSLRMRLSLLSSKPKALLLAIAAEGFASHLTSGAFVRKHRLASTSSVQSAVKQLLSEDWITFSGTDKDVCYSLSDKFMQLWIRKNYL